MHDRRKRSKPTRFSPEDVKRQKREPTSSKLVHPSQPSQTSEPSPQPIPQPSEPSKPSKPPPAKPFKPSKPSNLHNKLPKPPNPHLPKTMLQWGKSLDCGIFSCKFLEYLVTNTNRDSLNLNNMPVFRKQYVAELWANKFLW